ncbi:MULTISPECIES: GH32 C-terminal domain-containing protein [Arenibacter]|uniref:GH32 C-terminal domain-containing protein n=1 Tax=Arenibacter TaxID=178469 RepID=UPI003342632B
MIYDIHNKTLLSKELLPDDSNHINIRLLVDWGQLEVFGNNGVFSYSQQFAFSPDQDSLELFTDGELKLVSMEFHEIARTW